jgi:hypothetical protein
MWEDEENKNEEENFDPDLDRTSSLQEDKIFNNNYESTDLDTTPISFQPADGYGSQISEENIEYNMIYEVVSKFLDESEFTSYNKPDKEGNFKKLNKMQINEVYSYALSEFGGFPRVQLFSVVQDYFDINSNKFYDSLSNTFKKELIEELRNGGSLKEKTGGPLF